MKMMGERGDGIGEEDYNCLRITCPRPIICDGFVFGSLACWSRLGYGPLVLAWMFLYATFPIQNL